MDKVINKILNGKVIQQYENEYKTSNKYIIDTLDEFIRVNYLPYKTNAISTKRSSYGIKHDIEKILQIKTKKYIETNPEMYIDYISNLDVKEAFARAGFNSWYYNDTSINCYFNIDKKVVNRINKAANIYEKGYKYENLYGTFVLVDINAKSMLNNKEEKILDKYMQEELIKYKIKKQNYSEIENRVYKIIIDKFKNYCNNNIKNISKYDIQKALIRNGFIIKDEYEMYCSNEILISFNISKKYFK